MLWHFYDLLLSVKVNRYIVYILMLSTDSRLGMNEINYKVYMLWIWLTLFKLLKHILNHLFWNWVHSMNVFKTIYLEVHVLTWISCQYVKGMFSLNQLEVISNTVITVHAVMHWQFSSSYNFCTVKDQINVLSLLKHKLLKIVFNLPLVMESVFLH